MIEVKSYQNADEMFADLDKLRIESIRAFNNCSDKQKALKEGDIFLTSVPEYDLIIFNEIQVLDEEDKKEFEYAKEAGYVMVKAWSNACPEGEMGSVHRSRAVAKIIDSKVHTAEFVFKFILSILEEGGQIDKFDMQWIKDTKNLEVFVSNDSKHD
jgi:hypothetical protein